MSLTNQEMILRALRLLHPEDGRDNCDWNPDSGEPRPAPPIEIRYRFRTDHGERCQSWLAHQTDVAATLAEKVSALDNTVAVWTNLNRIDPAVDIKSVKDANIIRRTHILIDGDTKRPKDTNASHEEVQAAIDTMTKVRNDLQAAGWPDPMTIMSGNGCQLIYAIDEPAKTDLVQRVLHGLAAKYNNDKVKIDTSVHNPGRVTKLPGTAARKADDDPDRRQRMARIIEAPDKLDIVPTTCLEAVAVAEVPQQKATVQEAIPAHVFDGTTQAEAPEPKVFDVAKWLTDNEVSYKVREKGGSKVYEIPCPFKPGHTDGGACIMQAADGSVTAHCHHHSCDGKDWRDFRRAIDPHWRELQSCPTKETVRDSEYLARRHLETMPPCYLYRSEVWCYDGGIWRPQEVDDLKIAIRRTLMKVFGECRDRLKVPSVTETMTNNVLGCFRSIIPSIPRDWEMPCWINGRPANVLVTANGILDLDSGNMREHSKRLFARFKLPYPYQADAKCVRFQAALKLIFDDPNEITLTQEIFGNTLVGGNERRAIWLFQGATHGGKGLLTTVLCHLLGSENYTSIRPAKFSGQFALWNARGKLLIVVPDINGKKALPPAFVEAAKIISGGDPIDIDGKNQRAVCEILPAKLLLITNDLLEMQDDSAALYTRFVPLKFVHSFFPVGHPRHEKGRVPNVDLEDELKKELPGILNWALEGLKRVREENKFTLPAASQTLCDALEDEGSPILQFVRDRLDKDATGPVPCSEVYAAYYGWCCDEGIDEKDRLTNKQLGRALRAALPKVIRDRAPNGERHYVYHNVAFKAA